MRGKAKIPPEYAPFCVNKWICGGNDEYHQRLETLKKTPTLHVHGNARCPLSPLNPRRQLLRPRRQIAKAKRKRNKTKAGI